MIEYSLSLCATIGLLRWARLSRSVGLALTLALASAGHAQTLSAGKPFPGDDALVTSAGKQSDVVLAPGGPGYLAVWEDQRPNLTGFTGAAGAVAAGNLTDIYAARLDTAGNVLDTTPIIVSNEGHNQTEPRVAWNGTHWLVVWVSQRPDWYFFEDIVGVRIAADGTVLDSQPIVIRPETNSPANNYGENPTVASDGTNWVVVWEAFDLADGNAILQSTRIAPDGTVLDPNYVTLYKWSSGVFGPEFPSIASVGGEYLLVWNDFGPVRMRRFDGALNPLDVMVTIPGLLGDVTVTASTTGYLVLATLEAVRVSANGTILDPTPIQIPNVAPVIVQGASVRWPSAAWTGSAWAVTYSIPLSGSNFDDADIWLVRIDGAGNVLDPNPIGVDTSSESDVEPIIAGDGNGQALLVYTSWNSSSQRSEDVRATHVDATGQPTGSATLSTGLARQENLTWVRGPGYHLALFTSRMSGATRIMAQRFNDGGVAIDAQPTVVHQSFENQGLKPDVAWNGSVFLVTWLESSGLVMTRRMTADLQLLGFGATPVMALMDGNPAVGALGDNFLVAVSDLFSVDQRTIKAVRIDGTSGAVLDSTPFMIGFDFSVTPTVEALGANWLVVWARKPCHDCRGISVYGRLISPSGQAVTPAFVVNGPGGGSSPSVAIAGETALVAYSDDTFLDEAIEARLVRVDGTLIGSEIRVADPPSRQLFPSAGFDGAHFVVAWADNRTVTGVEQMRADIYAARITAGGTLLDPDGFPVETGVLPEDYPAVTSGSSRTLIGYLMLDGADGTPEVQRLRYRAYNAGATCQEDLGYGGPGTTVLWMCGEPLVGNGSADLVIDSDVPNSPAILGFGPNFLPTPLFGGTLVTLPPAGLTNLTTDAQGNVLIPGLQGGPTPMTVYVQAVVFDPSLPTRLQISNAIQVTSTP